MNPTSIDQAIYYLNTLIQTTSEAIIIVDVDTRVKYWSSHAEEIYGISFVEIENKKITNFFEKEDLKLIEILETKIPVFNVYHHPRKDKHVLISSSPILDEKGNLIGALSIDQDITDIVNLNEKLSSTTSELQKIKQQYNIQAQIGPLNGVIGKSEKLQKTKELTLKVAQTDATILIQGESGVGKELFAQGVHEASMRNEEPFIPINCGAIPEALFESEFFGYEKGAFTGANDKGKAGKVEMANNGTLFLDEVGMLPLDMQVKLLRIIQERDIWRVGGNRPIKINIRIVAATNRNLRTMVERGEFREDLYYRLNVVTLNIPSLRERKEDIPELVNSFVDEFAVKYHKKSPEIMESAMEMFIAYSWPGNIRELRNVVERMIIFLDSLKIYADDIIDIFPDSKEGEVDKNKLANEKALHEKEEIIKALKKTFGNKTAAAKELDISRVSLYKKLKKYNIDG